MSDQSLDDVLSGVEPTFNDVPADPTPTAEVDPPAAEVEPTAEPIIDAPAASTKEPDGPETWTKAAVLDERRKRQALERQLEEMNARLSQSAQPAQQEIDPFEDPKSYFGQLEQKLKGETYKARVELSQDMMRSLKPDYDELESEFVDIAKENPSLWQQLQVSPNPAKFAYETAEKARKLKSLQNVDQLEAKIRAELEQKIRAELQGEIAVTTERADKIAQIKPSLASARSSNGTGDADDYDRSLQDLFGR